MAVPVRRKWPADSADRDNNHDIVHQDGNSDNIRRDAVPTVRTEDADVQTDDDELGGRDSGEVQILQGFVDLGSGLEYVPSWIFE